MEQHAWWFVLTVDASLPFSFSFPLCFVARSFFAAVCSGPCAAVEDVDVGADANTAPAAVAFGPWVGMDCALPSIAAAAAAVAVEVVEVIEGLSGSVSRGDGDGDDCLSLPELWLGDDCDVLDAVGTKFLIASTFAPLCPLVNSLLCPASVDVDVGFVGDGGWDAGGVRLCDGKGFLACAAATSFLDASTASVALLWESSWPVDPGASGLAKPSTNQWWCFNSFKVSLFVGSDTSTLSSNVRTSRENHDGYVKSAFLIFKKSAIIVFSSKGKKPAKST